MCRLTTLENLDYDVNINTAKETVTENIKISAEEILGSYELKQQKS
jgi:ribosomal protein S18